MKPLSEEFSLLQTDPLPLHVAEGKTYNWNEVTTLKPGERRIIDLDIQINKGAKGEMLRVFFLPAGSGLTVLQTVRVAEQGSWHGLVAIAGAGEIFVRRVVHLEGQGASARLNCVGVLDKSAKASVAEEILANEPQADGQILTKIVLNDDSRSEARARIVLGDKAQNSQAFERLDHLLLGDRAQADVIPELEVKTDKVKCGHAATTSRPETEQVWYLTSRGLNETEANKLLTRAFLEPVLADLPANEQAEVRQVIFA